MSDLYEEYQRLRQEYHVTLRVLACVVEKLQGLTQQDMTLLDDYELLHSPDLQGYRDEDSNVIALTVSR